jgi:AmmeMemoRadiSam system protein B
MVDALLDAIDVPADDPPGAGYIVPHAGYRYSGATAAQVYARLRRHAAHIERVMLVGPAHRVPVKGCAVPTTNRWLTPLGEVVVDPVARGLVADGLAAVDDQAHAPEHSLEVQVPFLQRALPGVSIVPVVAGLSTAAEVGRTVAAVAGNPGTVVVCSTDLSHYLPDDQARARDERTAGHIEALEPDALGVRDACGLFALRGVVSWARDRELVPRRLALTTSGDTGGDRARVVGYPAFEFAFAVASQACPNASS